MTKKKIAKAGTADAHGAPLGADEIRGAKAHYGYPSQEPFHVPDEARAEWAQIPPAGAAAEARWRAGFEAYRAAFPELAAEFERTLARELPEGWEETIPDLSNTEAGGAATAKAAATRGVSGKVLNALATRVPELVGGSADLGPSNKTDLDGADSLLPATPGGRLVHFGVREHAMGAILNGIALHGRTRVFGGTFLIFSDYMRPSVRLAALMNVPVTYVWTHDSVALGDDGPTHQPVEQLASLRAIPGLSVVRPADANETAHVWKTVLERREPAGIALTRQNIPVFERGADTASGDELAAAHHASKGAYVLAEAANGEPDVILIATGSEVSVALEARSQLAAEGIRARVVSAPCLEWFEQQPAEYRESVLPRAMTARVSIEAGIALTWHRYIGDRGRAVSIEHFGASADYQTLFREFGITAEATVAAARESISAS